MPPEPRRIDDWKRRIEVLKRLGQTAPELAWLWEIRRRVLEFLVARYGDAPVAQRPIEAPGADSHSVGTAHRFVGRRRGLPPEPRLTTEEMQELLVDIREIAAAPERADAEAEA